MILYLRKVHENIMPILLPLNYPNQIIHSMLSTCSYPQSTPTSMSMQRYLSHFIPSPIQQKEEKRKEKREKPRDYVICVAPLK